MTRRENHIIECICVSFDDDCYYETSDYNADITAMDIEELNTFKSAVRTGEDFVKEISAKIKQAIGV